MKLALSKGELFSYKNYLNINKLLKTSHLTALFIIVSLHILTRPFIRIIPVFYIILFNPYKVRLKNLFQKFFSLSHFYTFKI